MPGPDIKPVDFLDSFGNRLGGILHLPQGETRGAGVVIVVSGVKDRVGPHRIYTRLARHLSRMGYPVLRYDPCGIGESDGRTGNHRTSFHFSWIQKGLFGDSIARAADVLRERTGVDTVVLSGLCGGATAAVVADEPRGVDGYVLLAPSAVFDDVGLETGLLKSLGAGRGISGDATRHVLRYVVSTLKKKIRLVSKRNNGARKVFEADVNFCFTRGFRRLVHARKKILCVVIDDDPTCREFETFVLGKYRARNVDVFRVSGVGHEFGSVDVVTALQERIGGWMDSCYGPDRQAGGSD